MFHSIEQIKTANEAAGQYWFSPDTMRFFQSRTHGAVINGHYFISSECDGTQAGLLRRYTIHKVNADGKIKTIGNFRAYETEEDARVSAEQLS